MPLAHHRCNALSKWPRNMFASMCKGRPPCCVLAGWPRSATLCTYLRPRSMDGPRPTPLQKPIGCRLDLHTQPPRLERRKWSRLTLNALVSKPSYSGLSQFTDRMLTLILSSPELSQQPRAAVFGCETSDQSEIIPTSTIWRQPWCGPAAWIREDY